MADLDVDGKDEAEDIPEDADATDADATDSTDDVVEAPRRGRVALVVSLVVAVVVAGFVVVLATGEPAQNRRARSPLIGKLAPPLEGETLDGGNFDIGDHRGQWVVVNFFATWCVPCRQEHDDLVAFDEAHGEAGDAVLVSVLFDDNPDTAREYFEDNGGDWPLVIDGTGTISTTYGVPQVPETYVVAPNGRVAVKLIGGVTQDGLERVIRELEGAAS